MPTLLRLDSSQLSPSNKDDSPNNLNASFKDFQKLLNGDNDFSFESFSDLTH
jgi:hypothetical protein